MAKGKRYTPPGRREYDKTQLYACYQEGYSAGFLAGLGLDPENDQDVLEACFAELRDRPEWKVYIEDTSEEFSPEEGVIHRVTFLHLRRPDLR